ncbi:MAG: hypothetical protein R3A52_19145 [Polyangiales bacterium]
MGEGELSEALAPLFTALDLLDGPSLWVLTSPSPAAHARVTQHIDDALAGSMAVDRFNLSDEASLSGFLRDLDPKARGVVAVTGLEALEPERRRRCLAALSRGREALAETRRAVVLLVTPSLLPELIQHAGDFWTWRRGTLDLCDVAALDATDPDEPSRQRRDYLARLRSRVDVYELPVPDRYLGLRRGRQRPTLDLWSHAVFPEEVIVVDAALRHPVGRRRWADVLRGPRPTVLVGPPGIGKTTALRLLALTLARGDRGEVRERLGGAVDLLPVLLDATSFTQTPRDWSVAHLVDALPAALSAEGDAALSAGVVDAVRSGKALLLIDAVERITSWKTRALLFECMERACAEHPGLRCVVAMREYTDVAPVQARARAEQSAAPAAMARRGSRARRKRLWWVGHRGPAEWGWVRLPAPTQEEIKGFLKAQIKTLGISFPIERVRSEEEVTR